MKMMKITLLTAIMVLYVTLFASNIEIQIRRLEYIQELIEQRKEELDKAQQQKDTASEQKTVYENRLSRTLAKIDNLSQQEYAVIEELIDKEHNSDHAKKRLEAYTKLCRRQLSQFVINTYSNEDFKQSAVEEYYFPLLITQTNNKIDEVNEQLTLTQSKMEQGREKRQQINLTRSSQRKTSRSLESQIAFLKSTIDSLSAEELDNLQDLHALEKNQEALSNLITHLQSDQQKVSYKFTKEKLLWPVAGEIVNYFGETRDEEHNFVFMNNGIDIKSDLIQEVCAVDFGIVVFAESFRNYGRMVIIDHRNGYYSLYANNRNLLVTKGDTVSIGEPVATLGRNDSDDAYLLHFELRRHNRPVNPLDYLK